MKGVNIWCHHIAAVASAAHARRSDRVLARASRRTLRACRTPWRRIRRIVASAGKNKGGKTEHHQPPTSQNPMMGSVRLVVGGVLFCPPCSSQLDAASTGGLGLLMSARIKTQPEPSWMTRASPTGRTRKTRQSPDNHQTTRAPMKGPACLVVVGALFCFSRSSHRDAVSIETIKMYGAGAGVGAGAVRE